MAYIKFTLSVILFYLLYSYDYMWYPLVSTIVKVITCSTIAWFVARRVTRDFICKKLLSTVNPEGRAVLITGCDSGLGYGAALKFNQKGFFVFAGCLDVDGSGAKNLIKQSAHPGRLMCVQLNVTNEDEVAAAYSKVQEILSDQGSGIKQLYAVINNAGIGIPSLVEFGGKGPQDPYVRHLEVNTFGVMRVTKTFLPLLRKARDGRIVNISSMASRTNMIGLNPYSVSKCATSKFTEGLQDEYSRFGIKAIDINPWFFKTPLTESGRLVSGLMKVYAQSNDEVRQAYAGVEKEQAAAVEFLMTNEHIVCEDSQVVVDVMVDAVTSAEPDLVYRIIPPVIGAVIWFTHDFLPWEGTIFFRKLLDFAGKKFRK